jgi:hypothetical protein
MSFAVRSLVYCLQTNFFTRLKAIPQNSLRWIGHEMNVGEGIFASWSELALQTS